VQDLMAIRREPRTVVATDAELRLGQVARDGDDPLSERRYAPRREHATDDLADTLCRRLMAPGTYEEIDLVVKWLIDQTRQDGFADESRTTSD
jgi:hypothetical protein